LLKAAIYLLIGGIRDIGYSRRYFKNMLKKIAKCDITSSSTIMIAENLDGYDFSLHLKKYKIKEMKVSKDIGWSFGNEGLSDSYILYKKILKDKLKYQFLNYFLEKINIGLEEFIDGPDGKLVANVKNVDYDQLWKDYNVGNITGSELTNILYHT